MFVPMWGCVNFGSSNRISGAKCAIKVLCDKIKILKKKNDAKPPKIC